MRKYLWKQVFNFILIFPDAMSNQVSLMSIQNYLVKMNFDLNNRIDSVDNKIENVDKKVSKIKNAIKRLNDNIDWQFEIKTRHIVNSKHGLIFSKHRYIKTFENFESYFLEICSDQVKIFLEENKFCLRESLNKSNIDF
jgi:hypothetical protein